MNRPPKHALLWVNLTETILSEGRQTQKGMCSMIPFIQSLNTGKINQRR